MSGKKIIKGRWSKKDEEYLIQNYKNGVIKEMSLMLDRSETAIKSKARKLGLRRSRYWTKKQKDILLNNLDKTYRELELIIPNKEYKEIKSYCQIYKIRTASYQKPWEQEDDEWLIESSYDKTLQDAYKKFPDRSKDSIRGRLQYIGVSIKDEAYWTRKDTDTLLNNYKTLYACEIKELLDYERSEAQIYSKGLKMGFIVKHKPKERVELNLVEVFKNYKNKLEGDSTSTSRNYPREYDMILFKYYLNKNNIKHNRDWFLNLCLGEFLGKCGLQDAVKLKWDGYYEFISACFPKYKFKEYEFANLDVKEGFWLNDYNCFDHIRRGVGVMLKDGVIENESQIIDLDIQTLYKYFKTSMFYFRRSEILYEYLDFFNIPYDNRIYFDGALFDSAEELSVYKLLKQFLKTDVCKNRERYYNANFDESYIPDFIIEADGNSIIIEYFGLYNESGQDFIIDYVKKTHRKIDFFNNLDGYLFIDLYPEDLKYEFKGVRNKLASFFNIQNERM